MFQLPGFSNPRNLSTLKLRLPPIFHNNGGIGLGACGEDLGFMVGAWHAQHTPESKLGYLSIDQGNPEAKDGRDHLHGDNGKESETTLYTSI